LTDLRVGTWNVEYARGVVKNRARLDLLNSYNADVWVLTETHDELDLSASHTAIHSEQRYSTPGDAGRRSGHRSRSSSAFRPPIHGDVSQR
jgi:uncharacterized protein (UPF0371 family)